MPTPHEHFDIGEHARHFPVSSISFLAPYSGLILSVVLVIFFLIRFYILQDLLPKIYGTKYTGLDDINRRGFLNHHIAGGTKITILIVAAYPFACVAFGNSNFHTPVVKGSRVQMGDLLLVAAQMLTGMFIFELIYRVKISPVSVLHHIGSILVAQAAITISIKMDPESSIEFMLCTIWGAFDIIAESLPHFAIILYRVYPTSHYFLANVFKFACITTFIGTISETVLTMYVFGTLWNRWPLSFKILTPILHIAFSAAQFHGTRIFYGLWKRQERLLSQQQQGKGMDLERAEVDNKKEERRSNSDSANAE
ncbi:hypothetical protein GALMADRAFT_61294 [Galerina marginata CBS 339.88]|uniref:TLC domain-containing protein n=1 Tax=Galerina marginata (strain CBS 339.88) TaxID=685588 RepID=A0A067TF88_GALM3|nr:hypothetical protein GALMADRAFT_61294 [Galerina marginata CBS 339.88]